MRDFQEHYQQQPWHMVEQYLGARPPVPPNAPKESFAIKMVYVRDCNTFQQTPTRTRCVSTPGATLCSSSVDLGSHLMAPVAEGLRHVCATFVGECCTCLDVQITLLCFREEDYGYCRMCSADIVVNLPHISRHVPPEVAVDALIGARQGAQDVQEGHLLQWRGRIDRLTRDEALIPDWMRSQAEVHTWHSTVPMVCFNFVGMHRIDRVIRQYGGEQPVPRHPVDVTRFMTSTARGDDVWWPTRQETWYDGWRRRMSSDVMVTVHAGTDPRGTRQYYDWYVGAAAGIRFLTRAANLNDPRWNMAPPDLPADSVHARDELTMPDDAPAPRRRGTQEPPPRMAAPVRGRLTRRDQRRRTRMLLAGAAAHMDEERVEEEQEYDRQKSLLQDGGDDGRDDGGDPVHDDVGFQILIPTGSSSGLISFSPTSARQFPSPFHAGTSSEFIPQSQDQAGLDMAYQIQTCPPDQLASLVASFRASRGVPSDHVSSSGQPVPPPPSTTQVERGTWVPTYSSPPVVGIRSLIRPALDMSGPHRHRTTHPHRITAT
ncbi:hypothetical protein PIB30_027081 [Stylosanthes scabra]|uniref:Aminotransferase-like plant mobile domain-containing protein n=1 Tax=Stylosanthes scabra TaxID=79078 RepID=A0ABU6UCH7_9FABA|nr:hypothetical protein [Stylosanthes scabra]